MRVLRVCHDNQVGRFCFISFLFFFGPAASIGLFVYKKRAERVIIPADWPASSASISSIADPITARFYRDNELLLALASQYWK